LVFQIYSWGSSPQGQILGVNDLPKVPLNICLKAFWRDHIACAALYGRIETGHTQVGKSEIESIE
jgi:hypothetical protein